MADLLHQVAGRTPLVIELKSHWGGDDRLARRAVAVLNRYDGPFALMSFDPDMVQQVRDLAPAMPRGIVADRVNGHDCTILPFARRLDLRNLGHLPRTRPHFLSYDVGGLPSPASRLFREAGLPVICWTVRDEATRARALNWCDQITFEGFFPMPRAEAASPVVRIAGSLQDVDAGAWDACANPSGEPCNPFVSHSFLSSLEESGSAGAETGWYPQHLLMEATGGSLIASAPCYAKGHSQGEYVFDHGWAEAWHRRAGTITPSCRSRCPSRPYRPRLLSRPGPERDLAACSCRRPFRWRGRIEVSSVHITFMSEAEAGLFEAPRWLVRQDTQFHWENRGYGNFDDFLAGLASRKRKTIRKERAGLAEGPRHRMDDRRAT